MILKRLTRGWMDSRLILLPLLLGLLLAVPTVQLLAAPLAQPRGEEQTTLVNAQAKDIPVPQTSQASPAAPLTGDPIIGKDLFTGVIQFRNGGPPCMACHSVAGIGALGGGTLGPDLTAAYSKFGEEGMNSLLASLPFPTMNPIFSKHPLTPEEQDHLKVFLKNAAVAQRPPEAVGQLAILAVAGAVILVALGHFYWRNRLSGVRRPMVERRA